MEDNELRTDSRRDVGLPVSVKVPNQRRSRSRPELVLEERCPARERIFKLADFRIGVSAGGADSRAQPIRGIVAMQSSAAKDLGWNFTRHPSSGKFIPGCGGSEGYGNRCLTVLLNLITFRTPMKRGLSK